MNTKIMRRANVYVQGEPAGILTEVVPGREYVFEYMEEYTGLEVSRTMQTSQRSFTFDQFPPFFEGLLPEGMQLDGLLSTGKIDKNDYFSQLMAVGEDLVGVVTLKEITE